MSSKRFALCCVFLVALPAFAKSELNPCGYAQNVEKFEIQLQSDAPRDRERLVEVLQCLRSAELEEEQTADDSPTGKRIILLETLASRDLQRLTERLGLLDKLEVNGASPTSQRQYDNVRASVNALSAVVRMVDGKPVLVTTLFTELHDKQKKKADQDAADVKEDKAKAACTDDEALVKLKDAEGLKRCIGVLKDALAANALAAEKSPSPGLAAAAKDFHRQLDAVQDKGPAIAAAVQKNLDDLHDQAKKADDAKASEAEKKKIADAIAEKEQTLALIADIAIEPSAKRHCREDGDVSLKLDDAKSVKRCVDALNDAISSAKFEAQSPQVTAARDRVNDLATQLTRIIDFSRLLREASTRVSELENKRALTQTVKDGRALDEQISRVRSDLTQQNRIPIAAAARSICGSGSDGYLVLAEADSVENCIHGLRLEIGAATEEVHRACAMQQDGQDQDKLLKQKRERVIKKGVLIANRRAKESADLDDKIAAAKDTEKDALNKQKAEADADVVLLTEIAVDPDAEQACIDDAFVQLDIKDTKFVTRCLTALGRKVRELRSVDTATMSKDDRKRNREDRSHYELQLARFEEAGRRMARRRGDDLADAVKKHEAATTDADKTRYDHQQKVITAELDSLRKLVIIPNEDPQTEFADYEQWFMKMAGGYEYVGATDAFAKGFPEISATIGFQYPRSAVPVASSNWHPWAYGDYITFTIALTNSGEAKTTPFPSALIGGSTGPVSSKVPRALDDTTPVANSDSTPASQITRALEFEFQSFHPVWRNDFQVENPRLRTSVGPMVIIGGRKLDNESFVHQRIYAGLRTARSPDTFADLLYGRTGGLRSHRLEVRGQYAFPHAFKNNARLSIGAVGNFGLNKRKFGECEEASSHCQLEEKDVVKFYLSYDVDTTGLLNLFGFDQKPKTTP